jgi:hypothetical protein
VKSSIEIGRRLKGKRIKGSTFLCPRDRKVKLNMDRVAKLILTTCSGTECSKYVQFVCAFHHRMRFQCHFQCRKLKIDIENACDGETHIQTAHLKRECNRPLSKSEFVGNSGELVKVKEYMLKCTISGRFDILTSTIMKRTPAAGNAQFWEWILERGLLQLHARTSSNSAVKLIYKQSGSPLFIF